MTVLSEEEVTYFKMAWYLKCTLITHFFMVSWFYVQGANNGFMVSTYSPYDGRIKAYQGDVESMINMATVPSKQVSLRYSYITSLAADPQNGSLYLLDVQFKSIYRLDHVNVWFNNSKMAFTRLHEGISIAIGSIVFDWISRNIYWTDRYHNWISMMPVSTNDSLMFRAVVEEGVSVPVALAIDPKAGLLFWSDTQPSARIEWSNLLGENRTVMLSGNMKFIIALAVDPEGQMLYFTDYLRQTLEAVQYGGYNRTVLVRLNTYQLVDMAFYKDYLCVVDQRYRRTLCYSTTGKKVLSDTLYSNPWGICVFDKSTQSTNVTDYCSEMNCTHFCVNMPTKARCVCKEGFDLQDDNITCIAKHGISGKGLVFTNGTGMCILHITSITGAKIQPECIEANLGNGTSYLQADSNEGKIHFWNATGKMLQTYDLLSNTTRLITHTGNNVTGLFYDWIADDLYWSESDTGLIKVAALKQATVEVTNIFTQLSNPKSLTGNPHKYELYWISGNSSSGSMAILRGSFNGTDVNQVVNSSNGIGSPIALVFDEVRHRLYWLDNDRVRSVNTDGTVAEQHIRPTGANTFLIYKDYFIWRVGRNEIRAAFLDSSNPHVRIDLKVHGNVTGLCVFDSRIQRKERGPCEEDNGKCEHICLPSESGPVCRCKIGYKIAPDGKTCKSDILTNNFALLVDNNNEVIYQVPTDTKSVSENDLMAHDIPEMKSPVGVLYDNSTGYMYWTELRSQWMRKTKPGSKNVTTVIKLDFWYPDRMAMDELSGYLYYTAVRRYSSYRNISYIGVLRFDLDPEQPKNKQILKGLHEPRGIAIHPKKGLLFWSDVGAVEDYIGRSDMDGQNPKLLVTGTNVRTPIGLSIDYSNEHLYWADLVVNQIKRVNLEGGDYEVFYTDSSNPHPSDVVVQGAYVFYISWNQRKITKLNKDSAAVVDWMSDIPDLGRLDNLQIFPADKQPTNEACGNNNGGCSAFCLLKPNNTKVCACEEKVGLRDDNRTCTNVCKSIVRNGMIENNCTIIPGAVCGYTCDKYFKKKNQTIDKIECLKDRSWNETNLCEAILCKLETVRITNGNVNSTCTGQAGVTCDYTCNSGYRKTNANTTFMCDENAKWNTDFTGLCKEITCDLNSINIQNGKLTSGCFGHVGSICNYECNSGYKKNDTLSTFICTSTGEWNTDFQELCTPNVCNLASINNFNGKINSGCTGQIGDICNYTCDSGYKRNEAFASFECTSKGEWNTDFKGLCTLIKCDVSAVNIANGIIVNGCTGLVDTTCDYTCGDGYKKSDQHPNFSCLSNGVWSTDFSNFCTLITCDVNSISIANGKVTDGCKGTAGLICDYTCNTNYQRSIKVPYFQCLTNGQWNTDFKDLCQLIKCDFSKVIITNGNINDGCHGNVDETCDYTCKHGYKKNNPSFKCTSNGQWNTDFKGFCKLITCGIDSINIPNGTVTEECTDNVGDTCDYTCSSGYQKSKVYPKIQCMSSGEWDADFKQLCKRTVCDTSAIKIQNGRVKDGCTGAIGEMCDYECDKDYMKTSILKRFSCTKNGIWDTDFMGFCRKIECDRDMLFQPGRLSVECEVLGGKICNYTCNEGYENSRISCFSNGTWNNSLSAMCKEIYEKNAPNSSQASKAGLIGGTIGGISVVILVAVIIITVICFIRIRRRKLSEQGVYKNNPNVPFPNQNLRNNPYEVFDNPPEPDRSNDGSIQFANPLTGIEQPPNNIYSESSNQPNLSIEGATGRGVQFSNPLCFVDDVYVSVSDKQKIMPDDETDDPQTFRLKDISETLTFNPEEKDQNYVNVHNGNP